jgi:hypothetical protein
MGGRGGEGRVPPLSLPPMPTAAGRGKPAEREERKDKRPGGQQWRRASRLLPARCALRVEGSRGELRKGRER